MFILCLYVILDLKQLLLVFRTKVWTPDLSDSDPNSSARARGYIEGKEGVFFSIFPLFPTNP